MRRLRYCVAHTLTGRYGAEYAPFRSTSMTRIATIVAAIDPIVWPSILRILHCIVARRMKA